MSIIEVLFKGLVQHIILEFEILGLIDLQAIGVGFQREGHRIIGFQLHIVGLEPGVDEGL